MSPLARKQAKRTKPPKRGAKVKDVEAKKMLVPPAGSPFKTIPQAGWDYFGLSKNGAYDAAERGDFGELITIGRRKFVATAVIEAKIRAAAQAAE
jgi:hypothetical protein